MSEQANGKSYLSRIGHHRCRHQKCVLWRNCFTCFHYGCRNCLTSDEGCSVVCGFFFLVPVASVVSAVLQIMGLSRASNDNANFKMALYAVITNLVASLINSALSGVVAVLFDVISWIALLATVYYVIKGVSELLPNSALAAKGKNHHQHCNSGCRFGDYCRCTVVHFALPGSGLYDIYLHDCFFTLCIWDFFPSRAWSCKAPSN